MPPRLFQGRTSLCNTVINAVNVPDPVVNTAAGVEDLNIIQVTIPGTLPAFFHSEVLQAVEQHFLKFSLHFLFKLKSTITFLKRGKGNEWYLEHLFSFGCKIGSYCMCFGLTSGHSIESAASNSLPSTKKTRLTTHG